MNNEPVAWLYRIKNTDNRWELSWIRPITDIFETEPLYTHPSEHDLGVAEAIGFDKGYKAATAKTLTDDEYDNIFANGKRLGVLETEDRFCKAKTLTDEEIHLVREVLDGCVSIIKTEIVQEKQTFKGYFISDCGFI